MILHDIKLVFRQLIIIESKWGKLYTYLQYLSFLKLKTLYNSSSCLPNPFGSVSSTKDDSALILMVMNIHLEEGDGKIENALRIGSLRTIYSRRFYVLHYTVIEYI